MSVIAEVTASIVGLVVGSFVGVVVGRVPAGKSIVSPSSRCMSCDAPVRSFDNVPVVSYLVLRGRCRSCGASIGPRDLAVELATGLLFGLVAWRSPSLWELPAYCVLAAVLVALSAIDLEHLRIPTPIIYVALGLGAPLLVLASAGTHRWPALVTALLAGAIAFSAFFVLFYAVPKGIGFGDVRLSGVCGAYLGWIGPREAVLGFIASFILAGLPAVVLLASGRVNRRTQVPFGPFLAAGTMVAVLFGTTIVHAWSGI